MAKGCGWNWRSLISFALLFSLIVLFLSGVLLYVSPSGRIARETGWQVLGLDRWDWESIHDLFGFFFIFIALIHLWLNRHAIACYLQTRLRRTYAMKKELIVALLLTGLVFLIAALDLLNL